MLSTIPDYEHKDNLRQRAYFEGLGYSFKINGDGYSVKFKEHFVCGAGVQLPRQSKTRRTWKHIQADMREYLRSAVNAARNHRDALLITNPDIFEKTWLIVWLDYKPNNKIAIALKSERSATIMENKLKNVSDITIFGSELYGQCTEEEILRRYSCKIYSGKVNSASIYNTLKPIGE